MALRSAETFDHAPYRQGLHDQSQPGVRLPQEFQLATDEGLIRKVGDDVILSPRPKDWRRYLEAAPVASPLFMAEVEDFLVQERES